MDPYEAHGRAQHEPDDACRHEPGSDENEQPVAKRHQYRPEDETRYGLGHEQRPQAMNVAVARKPEMQMDRRGRHDQGAAGRRGEQGGGACKASTRRRANRQNSNVGDLRAYLHSLYYVIPVRTDFKRWKLSLFRG